MKLNKHLAALSDRAISVNGYMLFYLSSLSDDILVSQKVLDRVDFITLDDDIITVDYPNCRAIYKVTNYDADLQAYEADFVTAYLHVYPLLDWGAEHNWQSTKNLEKNSEPEPHGGE